MQVFNALRLVIGTQNEKKYGVLPKLSTKNPSILNVHVCKSVFKRSSSGGLCLRISFSFVGKAGIIVSKASFVG